MSFAFSLSLCVEAIRSMLFFFLFVSLSLSLLFLALSLLLRACSRLLRACALLSLSLSLFSSLCAWMPSTGLFILEYPQSQMVASVFYSFATRVCL